MNRLPKAKLENIVVQNLNDETLIYNLRTNQAFCLNETTAKVFESCDGAATFAELKAKHHLTDEIIYLALDGLKNNNLIAADYVSPFAGLSRREVVRKIGLTSLIALPVISALVAPSAASAASLVCPTSGGNRPNGCPAGSAVDPSTSCSDADRPSRDAQCNTNGFFACASRNAVSTRCQPNGRGSAFDCVCAA